MTSTITREEGLGVRLSNVTHPEARGGHGEDLTLRHLVRAKLGQYLSELRFCLAASTLQCRCCIFDCANSLLDSSLCIHVYRLPKM
jgi:hypothetical protein